MWVFVCVRCVCVCVWGGVVSFEFVCCFVCLFVCLLFVVFVFFARGSFGFYMLLLLLVVVVVIVVVVLVVVIVVVVVVVIVVAVVVVVVVVVFHGGPIEFILLPATAPQQGYVLSCL